MDAKNGFGQQASERRIIGRMVMQVWGGRKGDDAIFVREEDFDATDTVHGLTYDKLQALGKAGDASDQADPIGLANLQWDGPFEVYVTEAICEYFGVGQIEDITSEQFDLAKRRHAMAAAEQSIRDALTQGPAAEVLRARIGDRGVKALVEQAIARARADANVVSSLEKVVRGAVDFNDDLEVDADAVVHASPGDKGAVPSGFWVNTWSYVRLRDALSSEDSPKAERRAAFIEIAKASIPREALLELLDRNVFRDGEEADDAFIDNALAILFDNDEISEVLAFKPAQKPSEVQRAG